MTSLLNERYSRNVRRLSMLERRQDVSSKCADEGFLLPTDVVAIDLVHSQGAVQLQSDPGEAALPLAYAPGLEVCRRGNSPAVGLLRQPHIPHGRAWGKLLMRSVIGAQDHLSSSSLPLLGAENDQGLAGHDHTRGSDGDLRLRA